VRTDQSLIDRRLAKLSEATAARSTALEMKIETSVSSFAMRGEMHPDAAAALRKFSAATLESTSEKLWVFDRGPAAGAA
jgi:hypothetical protein